jgi:hypothetical protein
VSVQHHGPASPAGYYRSPPQPVPQPVQNPTVEGYYLLIGQSQDIQRKYVFRIVWQQLLTCKRATFTYFTVGCKHLLLAASLCSKATQIEQYLLLAASLCRKASSE